MLTREHSLVEYDFAAGVVRPDRLTRRTHEHYVRYAEAMLDVYRRGVGRTRRELHRAVASLFAHEEDCPQRRIDAFCKLLDDVSMYDQDRRGRAAKLRQQVFQLAGRRHPLVRKADRLFESEELQVKAEIARQLGRDWDEIDGQLFADVVDFHRLVRFDGYPDAQALLARYNVAQVQTTLYDAVALTVWAREDFKIILRYAKLAQLMHTITRLADGEYRIRLDGPVSVLRQTRRYGVNLAKFLPALIACRNWRMHALIRTRRSGWVLSLDLSAADGLHSHLPSPAQFDSQTEESLAKRWGDEPREGWTLVREGEVLCRGQKTFVPDFVLRHQDGGTVLLEIVGFWTPEYLQTKLQTLDVFRDHAILLAVAERTGLALPDLPPGTITYKTVVKIKDLLESLKGKEHPASS
jgi:predicted nuclease of restriction endonuclease-like RecB superfamily